MSEFFCVVLSCVGRGPVMGRYSVQEVLTKCIKYSLFQKLILERNRPEGEIRETYEYK